MCLATFGTAFYDSLETLPICCRTMLSGSMLKCSLCSSDKGSTQLCRFAQRSLKPDALSAASPLMVRGARLSQRLLISIISSLAFLMFREKLLSLHQPVSLFLSSLHRVLSLFVMP